MMTCSICRHSRRKEIDKALVAGETQRSIASRFKNASRPSISRHKAHIAPHLARALKRAKAEAVATAEAHVADEIASGNDLVADLRKLITEAQDIAREARKTKNLSVAMSGIDKQSRVLELIAKLTGQLDESTRVNILIAQKQAAAEADTVAVTAATQRLAAGIFVVDDLGPQELKGVREPITLYRVVRPSGVRSRLDIAAGRFTPFIGREVELAILAERWERVQNGDGQNVLIVGEAGVGKSRLAYQFRDRLAAVPHKWLECGATPYTEGSPFHPVIALVSQGLAFTPEDTTSEKLGKLQAGLGALASDETVSLLADFSRSAAIRAAPDELRGATTQNH